MQPVVLRTERLVLGPVLESDVDDIERYCQDPLFEDYLTIPWPYHRSDAEFFVRRFVPDGWASGDEATWALRTSESGPLLGVIGLRLAISSLGFWLGAEHRGNGFVTEAVSAVADWGFAHGGVTALHWECFPGNLASAAVARKSGFTYDGSGPGLQPRRGGEPVLAWQGTLRLGDGRSPKPGWPA